MAIQPPGHGRNAPSLNFWAVKSILADGEPAIIGSDEALSIVTSGRGPAYDPDIVDSFLDHIGHGQKTTHL